MTNIVESDVLSLHVTEIAQPFAKCLETSRWFALRCKIGDSRDFARALGLYSVRWIQKCDDKEDKKLFIHGFPQLLLAGVQTVQWFGRSRGLTAGFLDGL